MEMQPQGATRAEGMLGWTTYLVALEWALGGPGDDPAPCTGRDLVGARTGRGGDRWGWFCVPIWEEDKAPAHGTPHFGLGCGLSHDICACLVC